MNRRNFLKLSTGAAALPLSVNNLSAKKIETAGDVDNLKLGHRYPGAYHEPNDLFTPEEITEAGFVFVRHPCFVHDFTNNQKPINRNYVRDHRVYNEDDHILFPLPDDNHKQMVCTYRMCSPSYIKTYDLDAGRRRGIESLPDYFSKKDIFKPMILDFIRENEYHYVHRITLGTSPVAWNGKFGGSDVIYFLYPVFIRGCRLPKKL